MYWHAWLKGSEGQERERFEREREREQRGFENESVETDVGITKRNLKTYQHRVDRSRPS